MKIFSTHLHRKKAIIISIFTLLLISGCNKESNDHEKCLEYETAFVESVNAPSNGTVGETIAMDVNFNVKNGCGGFNKFEETSNGNSKAIVVNAKYEGCPCTQAIGLITVKYNFTASVPGEYELKFKSGEDEYFIVNITIQ